MFAYSNAGHRCGNFAKLAANVGRSIWFEIERIELAGSTSKKQLNDGCVWWPLHGGRSGGLPSEQIG
jgi:hypothetical protein